MQSLKAQNSTRGMQKPAHKIALYIRVSTEEQAENPEGSIRNQEERLRETVKLKNHIDGNFGEITNVYKDVLSGKDANRPQLQKLLTAIRQKEVSLVMVSELSRLSRNMRDFSEMWELMRSCECGILSLRENFDTTTAAGEMVLYTIANIAQFERRQTAERITANFVSRARRGLYNGGPVPLGYRIDQENKGRLVVCCAPIKNGPFGWDRAN
jgi:site-specific DNA recombinase